MYEVPEKVNHNIPTTAVERYQEEIDNGLIGVIDASQVLIKPYILDFHQRKVMIRYGKIADKEFVRKLAQKEGKFMEEFKNEIVRRPRKYFGIGSLVMKVFWREIQL